MKELQIPVYYSPICSPPSELLIQNALETQTLDIFNSPPSETETSKPRLFVCQEDINRQLYGSLAWMAILVKWRMYHAKHLCDLYKARNSYNQSSTYS